MKILLNSPWKKPELPIIDHYWIDDTPYNDLKDRFIELLISTTAYRATVRNNQQSKYAQDCLHQSRNWFVEHSKSHECTIEIMSDEINRIIQNPYIFLSIVLTPEETHALKYRSSIILEWVQKDTTIRDGDDEQQLLCELMFNPLIADYQGDKPKLYPELSIGEQQFEIYELPDGSWLYPILMIKELTGDETGQYALLKMPPADSVMMFPIQ